MSKLRRTLYLWLLLAFGCLPVASPPQRGTFVSSDREPSSSLPLTSASCATQHNGHPLPLQPGRGDRIVLSRTATKTIAYVVNEDDAALHTIDIDAGTELAVTSLEGSPSSVVGLADGRLAVALRDRNRVAIYEPAIDISQPLVLRCSRSVAAEPVGLAASLTEAHAGSDGERILVTSGYGHALTVLSADELKPTLRVDLPRDPRAVLVNRGRAFVGHVSSSAISVVDLATGMTTQVDLLSRQDPPGFGSESTTPASAKIPLQAGQQFALTSADGRIFAPMVTVDPGRPKATRGYGGGEPPIKPFVGVIDLASARELRIDMENRVHGGFLACVLPRAAAASSAARVFVTCAGTDELIELDGRADNAAEAIRRRVRVPSGPLGLALDETRAVVLAQFDRQIAIVPFDEKQPMERVALSRPEDQLDEKFEQGRKLFHDSFDLRISGDGRACATCHPDGRDDGKTWSTPDGPRQTISLAGRLATSGPFGWFGNHKTLEGHLQETVKRLGGLGFSKKRDEDDIAALMAYVTRVKAPVVEVEDDSRIAAGRALFQDPRQGCASCHTAGETDRARHDVGSGHLHEASLAFDTPSLSLVAGSAPYFHDGRYSSLAQMLDEANDRMGHVTHLTLEQKVSLIAYMETLAPRPAPIAPPRTFVAQRASDLVPIAAEVDSPFEKEALASRPGNIQLNRVAVDLAAIPVVQIAPPIPWDTASPLSQGEPLEAHDIVIHRGCAAVVHHAAARIALDWRESSMTSALERCVPLPDVDGLSHWSKWASTTIDPLPDGRLRVLERRGFIRLGGREIRLSNSFQADAVRLAGGMAYVFRTQCEMCEPAERDQLSVIQADNRDVFRLQVLSLEPNHAAHAVSLISPWNVDRWNKATNSHIETGTRPGNPRAILFRLDISRTHSEMQARITAGSASCRPDSLECR